MMSAMVVVEGAGVRVGGKCPVTSAVGGSRPDIRVSLDGNRSNTLLATRNTRNYRLPECIYTPFPALLYRLPFIIPTKAFARDYGITGVRMSVCLFVSYHDN